MEGYETIIIALPFEYHKVQVLQVYCTFLKVLKPILECDFTSSLNFNKTA